MREPTPPSPSPAKPGGTLTKRDFLAIPDFSRDELDALLARAARLKSGEEQARVLDGKTLAMIFRKNSTRTRV